MLQRLLGNDWFPPAHTHPTYAKSAFYQCLQEEAVQRFWFRYVLQGRTMLIMQELVMSIPEPVRVLLKRMLSWNPDDRPSCQVVLQDPWFAKQFPFVSGDGIVNTAHARPPLRSWVLARPPVKDKKEKAQWLRREKQWQQHKKWLTREHETLRKKLDETPVADTLGEIERIVEQSVLVSV